MSEATTDRMRLRKRCSFNARNDAEEGLKDGPIVSQQYYLLRLFFTNMRQIAARVIKPRIDAKNSIDE